MSLSFSQLPHPGIQSLKPYVPGKGIQAVKAEHDIENIIKLASNENPLGASPQLKAALKKITPRSLATYPTSVNHPLRKHIANQHALDCEQVFLSNGSDFIFHLLMECFALHTGKHILTHDYAFITYEVQANTLGIPINKVPINSNWTVNINNIIESCNNNTAIIFLANPNNPTGCLIPFDEVKLLLGNIPQTTLLVLDEAYYEYIPKTVNQDAYHWLENHPNLVITRTFSKVYGLAALRLGFAMAHPDIIALLYRIQLPFVVNQIAMELGLAAMNDQSFVDNCVKINQLGLNQVQIGLDKLGLTHLPSACNFITIDCQQNAIELDKRLQKSGIITRPLNPYGLNQHLRVTIGTEEQNKQFLQMLSQCL